MELPITKPSQTCYGDEIDFNALLDRLKSKRFNGFIRVTSGASEGYILLENGSKRASSFENHSKMEAIHEIKSTVDDSKTLIEVFDLKKSQMKYLMDINKFFIIDSESKVENILNELNNKKVTENESDNTPATNDDIKVEKVPEITQSNIGKEQEIGAEVISKEEESYQTAEGDKYPRTITKAHKIAPSQSNSKPVISSSSQVEEKIAKKDLQVNEYREENDHIEPEFELGNENREQLMKKYGLKDVGEKEIDDILETYKGGILSDDDIEKIELTLMNKVKKSILGIPKIKGSEVMVFLDNTSELTGIINIITEYEDNGLFSRIRGKSRDLENLRRQITTITKMELKKIFRGCPEIIDDIEINVEIS